MSCIRTNTVSIDFMKKFFLSLIVFGASAGYVVYQNIGGGSASAAQVIQQTQTPPASNTGSAAQAGASPTPPTQPASSQSQTVTTSNSAATPATTPTQTTPAPAPAPKGQYADGTYTGSSADAYYGTVQVQAVIQNGKLASVNFLQYPNTHQTSVYINDQAMPYLQSEAIQAQGANVSGVSGATDTSMAFVQSLSDALAQAKN